MRRQKAWLFRSALLASTALCGLPLPAYALPQGGTVVEGQADIVQTAPGTLEIRQSSDRVVIEWHAFDVAQGESVHFLQPDQLAQALNRILGDGASRIMGELSANGTVVLSNANGILFGPGSQVDVGSLIATTANVTNADFMAGRLEFSTASSAAAASVINQGTITAAEGGIVALIAPAVANSGVIQARLGTVALAAGNTFTLDLHGDGLIEFAIDDKVAQAVQGVDGNQIVALASNTGMLAADGGIVLMTVNAVRDVVGQTINMSGVARAQTVAMQGGSIVLKGDDGLINIAGTLDVTGTQAGTDGGRISVEGRATMLTGTLDASGAQDGGSISVSGATMVNQGQIIADGADGIGGTIEISASSHYADSVSAVTSADGAAKGGTVSIDGGSTGHVFSSGTHKVTSSDGTGGTIELTGKSIALIASTSNATGATGGGTVKIGGDFQGGGTLAKADTTIVSSASRLTADATGSGDGGTVVVWSEQETTFAGSASARGGETGGDGGLIEVSSKGTLTYGGTAAAGAPAGNPGQLLLDPKNLVIGSSATSMPYYEYIDPTPGAGDQFGDHINVLATGNVIVTDPYDDTGATDAGAFHLFDGTTGGLISTAIGSTANDQVGETSFSHPTRWLSNGNYVVFSGYWQGNKGAVTLGNGLTGTAGVIGADNSLVGATANDYVGDLGMTVLPNGNVLVVSGAWNSARGAVTFMPASGGVTGEVSATNSLVGASAGDATLGLVTMWWNGSPNYLVGFQGWDNGATADAGAVVWGDGTTGVTGVVSTANALVGTNAGDHVGSNGEFWLLNDGSTLAVISQDWNGQAGAMTWGNLNSGIPIGAVSETNSLVGSPGDELAGGNTAISFVGDTIIVASPGWNEGRGAVKLINSGITGVATYDDALIGTTAGDRVGSGGTEPLSNGNFVIVSPDWYNTETGAELAGAVTWVQNGAALPRTITSANSLVGTAIYDSVGWSGVHGLSNGNFVVLSPYWTGRAEDGGGRPNVGAATFGNGSTGITGPVTTSNSLVGATDNDMFGYWGVSEVGASNYILPNYDLNLDGLVDVGSITWGSGTSGVSGIVSAANSLVGTQAGDQIGYSWDVMSNGSIALLSPYFDNGTVVDAGAVTWTDGNSALTGTLSSANSVVGLTAYDRMGNEGFYWTNGTNGAWGVATSTVDINGQADAGIAILHDGQSPLTGTVETVSGLRGTQAGDRVGWGGVWSYRDYMLVSSPYWNGGLGAVAYIPDGSTVPTAHNVTNSLMGQAASSSAGFYMDVNTTNGTVLANFSLEDSGHVRVGIPGSTAITYALGGDQTIAMHPDSLTSTLSTGTDVTLQASNDITVSDAILVDNASGNGGNLTMQAGRSIAINADVTTDNSNLTLAANQPASAGVVETNRDAGAGSVTVASGVTIDAGSGTVSMSIGSGLEAGTINTTGATIIEAPTESTAPATSTVTETSTTTTTQQVIVQTTTMETSTTTSEETSASDLLSPTAMSGYDVDPLASPEPLVETDAALTEPTLSTESTSEESQ